MGCALDIRNMTLTIEYFDPTSVVLACHLIRVIPIDYPYKPLEKDELHKILSQDETNLQRKDASRIELCVMRERIQTLLNSCSSEGEYTFIEYCEYLCMYCELRFIRKFSYYFDLIPPFEDDDAQPVIGGSLGTEMYYNHLYYEYVPFKDGNVTRYKVYLYDELVGHCDQPGYTITPCTAREDLPCTVTSNEDNHYDSPPKKAVDILPGIISRCLEKYDPPVVKAVDVLPGIIERHFSTYSPESFTPMKTCERLSEYTSLFEADIISQKVDVPFGMLLSQDTDMMTECDFDSTSPGLTHRARLFGNFLPLYVLLSNCLNTMRLRLSQYGSATYKCVTAYRSNGVFVGGILHQLNAFTVRTYFPP